MLDSAGTVVRVGLAAVWLIAGAGKVAAPGTFAVSVKAYEVFPDSVASLVAAVVPLLEVAFGLLLLFGVGIRVLGVLSGMLLVVYIAGIVQAWARGLSIDCGCFSSGGQVAPGQTQYPQDILRDTGFLVLAVWLMIRPRTRLSIDGWLAARQHRDTLADDAGSTEPEGGPTDTNSDSAGSESSSTETGTGSASPTVGSGQA